MRSIQEVGREILGGTPSKLYFMVGNEYGIKLRYIDALERLYGSKELYDSLETLLSAFSKKQLIPRKPSVYVVRYDFDFVSNLSDRTIKRLDKLNVQGTIVCLYEDDKSANKLDKYLPTYTVSIDAVDSQYLVKYLVADFPNLPQILVSNVVVPYCRNYYDAQLLCRALSSVPSSYLCEMVSEHIARCLGHVTDISIKHIKHNVAGRNFYGLCQILDYFDGEPSDILYAVLSVLLDLEKIIGNKYSESEYRIYANQWTRTDVYNMFVQTYNCLAKLRSITSDAKTAITQLFALLQFKSIPNYDL